VGAGYNISDYDLLLEFRNVNNLKYPLSIKQELGYRYSSEFENNFTFIGKNNSIIGILSDKASSLEIDLMLKRTMASFYEIYKKKDSENFLLTEPETFIDMNNFFYYNQEKTEFVISNMSNPGILSAEMKDGYVKILKSSTVGYSEITVQAKVPGKDIYAQSVVKVINPSSLYDDFEGGSLSPQISWDHLSEKQWQVTDREFFLGKSSLMSGIINTGEKSRIGVTLDLASPGTLLFAYKTSTRPYYHKLHFYFDGTDMSANESPDYWSGINDWRILSYSVRAGIRNFEWSYEKSQYSEYNQDAVWIDIVVLPDKFNEKSDKPLSEAAEFSAYPNPFNPSTRISFSLDDPETAQLMIFDIKGRIVAEIFKGDLEKGFHSFDFNGSFLSSGMYYSVLKYGEKVLTNRIVLAK
jgi:hypothetical protein